MWPTQRLRSLTTGLLIGIGAGLLTYAHVFDRLEASTKDLRFRMRGQRFAAPGIVTIGVQDKCMEREHCGPLPWSRRMWAEAVRKLKLEGARVIAFDIFFADASPDSEADAEFARAIRDAGNVVLPVFSPEGLQIDNQRGGAFRIGSFKGNVEALQREAAAVGHINILRDADGICRVIPVALDGDSGRVWHLSVVGASQYLGPGAAPVIARGQLILGTRRFDLAGGSQLPINFYGLGKDNPTATFLPFHALMEDRFAPGLFRDKLVVIGQAAPGLKNADIVTTPFGEAYGLNVQAETMTTLLSGIGVRMWGSLQVVAFLAFIGTLSGVALGGKRLYWTLSGLPLLLLGVMFFALMILAVRSTMIPLVPAVVVVLVTFVVSLGLGHFSHSREAQRYQKALEKLQAAEQYINEMFSPRAGERQTPRVPGAETVATQRRIASATPTVVLNSVGGALGAAGGYIYLRRGDKFTLAASYGPVQPPGRAEEASFYQQLAEYHARENRPLAASDPSAPDFVKRNESRGSFLSVRLALGEELVGFVTFYGPARTGLLDHGRFTAQELTLVITMTPHVLVALENARLHSDMQDLWLQSTRALVQTIEAKDPYTRGHSERAATYGALAARNLGLNDAECEIVTMTGVLHDIGKIGISEGILMKPGRLTDEEFAVIKTHPDRGVDIIQPMVKLDFLLGGIKHHHERFDGRGYPDGLKGAQIPLVARILGVADTFDAMTTDRPYRKRFTYQQVTELLISEKASQFDPEVTDAFAGAVTEEDFIVCRRAQEEVPEIH